MLNDNSNDSNKLKRTGDDQFDNLTGHWRIEKEPKKLKTRRLSIEECLFHWSLTPKDESNVFVMESLTIPRKRSNSEGD